MNNPTPQGGEPVWSDNYLWSDERINECIKNVLSEQPNHTPRGLARRVAYTVRDDLEAKLAQQAARIDELERQLSICSGYADKLRREKSELAEQFYRLRAGLPEKDGNE